MAKSVEPLKIGKSLDNAHEILVAVIQELTITSTNEVNHDLIRFVNEAAQMTWVALEKHYEDGGDEDEDN